MSKTSSLAKLKTSTYFKVGLWAIVCLVCIEGMFVSAVQKNKLPFGASLPAQTVSATTNQGKSLSSSQSVYNPATKAWDYDFSGRSDGALSKKDWNVEQGSSLATYHNELEAYTSRSSNVRIENGTLVLEARPESYAGKAYTSARVNTLGKFSFTYGTLEVDMMLPQGRGTWPAAWLMPKDGIYNPTAYGISKSDPLAWAVNGEIDFGESIGSLPGQNIPAAHSYNELHKAPTYTPAYLISAYSTYHKYGITKTPDKIIFTIDGVPYATREKTGDSALDWPFNQPYYLILNLAIGGDWAGTNGVDNSQAPWQLKIKSISYTPN